MAMLFASKQCKTFLPVLIGLLAFWWRTSTDRDPRTGWFCQDLPLSIRWTSHHQNVGRWSLDVCPAISWTYFEARAKFRDLARQFPNVQLHSFPIAKASTTLLDLTMDIAILPGKMKGTIVHSSGTHGIEGYAGSMIQLAMLQLLLQHEQSRQQQQFKDDDEIIPFWHNQAGNHTMERPTLVFIHAVNPFGMHYFRRVNENNVDLNRNAFIASSPNPNMSPISVDRTRSATSSSPYTAFQSLLSGRPISNHQLPALWYLKWIDGSIGFWCQAIPALIRHGYVRLKQALVSGQYEDPMGPFYGGEPPPASNQKRRRMEQSWETLMEFITSTETPIIKKTSVEIDASHSTTGSILDDTTVWIDVHTGLGKFGMDTLLSDMCMSCPTNSEVKTSNSDSKDELSLWKQQFPHAYNVVTPNSEDEDIMKGYDESQGIMTVAMSQLQQERQKGQEQSKPGIFMAQEFGTRPGLFVARALILENRMVQHPSWTTDNAGNKIIATKDKVSHYPRPTSKEEADVVHWGQTLIQSAFYPHSQRWRAEVTKRGVQLFLDAMEYTWMQQR